MCATQRFPETEWRKGRDFPFERIVSETEIDVQGEDWTVQVKEVSWDPEDEAQGIGTRVTMFGPDRIAKYETSGPQIRDDDHRELDRRRLGKNPPPPEFVVTDGMERVDAIQCPECDACYQEPGEAVYECSRCGQAQVGERRCGECNVFMAKVAEFSCPECEAPIEDGDVTVVKVVENGNELVRVDA